MDDNRWHLKRQVTVGELLSGIIILGAIYAFGTSLINEMRTANAQMDKRIAILEVKAEAQTKVDDRQDQTNRDGQQRIEAALIEIQRSLRAGQTPKTP